VSAGVRRTIDDFTGQMQDKCRQLRTIPGDGGQCRAAKRQIKSNSHMLEVNLKSCITTERAENVEGSFSFCQQKIGENERELWKCIRLWWMWWIVLYPLLISII
jgi:hypothetical protein